MIRISFSLEDPEGTRMVEQVGNEAEGVGVYCEVLLDGFEEWIEEVEV